MFLQHRVLTCCRSDVRFHSECPPGVNSTVSPVRFSTKKSSQKSQRRALGSPKKHNSTLSTVCFLPIETRATHKRESRKKRGTRYSATATRPTSVLHELPGRIGMQPPLPSHPTQIEEPRRKRLWVLGQKEMRAKNLPLHSTQILLSLSQSL